MAAKPTTIDRVRKFGVLNTVSLAWRIGRCIARAEATNTISNVAEAVINEVGGPKSAKILFRGKIVNVASLLSFQGGIRVPSYTASKSGVGGLTKLLANEWAPRGINVNAIAPGYIATNNTAALQADETRNRQILERIPEQRWGNPADIGGAAVFLSSRAADYVQGHILAVDGGWLAR